MNASCLTHEQLLRVRFLVNANSRAAWITFEGYLDGLFPSLALSLTLSLSLSPFLSFSRSCARSLSLCVFSSLSFSLFFSLTLTLSLSPSLLLFPSFSLFCSISLFCQSSSIEVCQSALPVNARCLSMRPLFLVLLWLSLSLLCSVSRALIRAVTLTRGSFIGSEAKLSPSLRALSLCLCLFLSLSLSLSPSLVFPVLMYLDLV